MKTEADIWREERERVARRTTARGRAAVAWFSRADHAQARPQRDPYAWVALADLLPVEREP